MNQRSLLFLSAFFASIFFTSNINAQCDLTVVSIDYGSAILPNTLAGECKPENTLNIEVAYSEGVSDSLKVNGKSFLLTGSPQTVQIMGIPQEVIVELVGTTCYRFEDVDLYGLPPAPVMMEGDTVVCAGETMPPIFLSGHANSTFHWTNLDGSCVQSLFFSGAYNEEWTYPHPGEFTVYQYIDGMVTAPLRLNIRVGLPIEIVGESYFCEGDHSTLNVLVNGQNITPDYEIMWYTPLGVATDVVSVNADIDYLYTVEVTDVSGCIGTASVWVEENSAPDVMILEPDPFCEASPIDLKAVAYGSGCLQGCDYVWEFPDGTVVYAQTIEVHTEGTYIITVTNTHGCRTKESVLIEENCEEVVSVENPDDAGTFALYPNPNSGVFDIEFPTANKRQLILFNLQGEVIYQVEHSERVANIDVRDLSLPAGMYVMQVREDDNVTQTFLSVM